MSDFPKLLRRGQVERLLGMSRWTLTRLQQRDPTFPRFFELAPGVAVMRADALRTWIRLREIEGRIRPPALDAPDCPGLLPIAPAERVPLPATHGDDQVHAPVPDDT